VYLLQIAWRRNLTPEDGQAKVKELMAKAEKSPIGQGRLAVDGITVHANPFPPRVQEMLLANVPGLRFDDFNFNYVAEFMNEADAKAAADWINIGLKVWAEDTPGWAADLEPVTARVLMDTDLGELAEMETF